MITFLTMRRQVRVKRNEIWFGVLLDFVLLFIALGFVLAFFIAGSPTPKIDLPAPYEWREDAAPLNEL